MTLSNNLLFGFSSDHADYQWEFIMQAVPCYAFVVSFVVRLCQLKDLGLPRRSRFSRHLKFELGVTGSLIFIRLLLIFHLEGSLNKGTQDPRLSLIET